MISEDESDVPKYLEWDEENGLIIGEGKDNKSIFELHSPEDPDDEEEYYTRNGGNEETDYHGYCHL